MGLHGPPGSFAGSGRLAPRATTQDDGRSSYTLPRTVGLGVVNSRQLHTCAGERCPCRSVSLFCASLRLRSQRQGLRAPPAFRVGCNGSCGPHAPQLLIFIPWTNAWPLGSHAVSQDGRSGTVRRDRQSVGNGAASQKAWGAPPTHGIQKTYLKLRLCVKLHSSILLSDLTTRLPYDRRLRRQLDSSRDQ